MNELVKSALSNITEGVCRPLRLRLEQVISPDIGPAVLHTLSGLIRFYLNTIGEVCFYLHLCFSVKKLTSIYILGCPKQRID